MWTIVTSFSIFTLFFINFATSTGINYVDPSCTVLVRPSRDPADHTNIFIRRRPQLCNIILPGGGVGKYTFKVNSIGVPIISDGIVTITSSNLDTGISPTSSGTVYAIDMGGKSAVPGLVLGTQLGGNGNELANIIPVSKFVQSAWNQFESQIYSCLSNGNSAKAKLLWTFDYRTSSATRPYKIIYTASFSGGSNTCETISETFQG